MSTNTTVLQNAQEAALSNVTITSGAHSITTTEEEWDARTRPLADRSAQILTCVNAACELAATPAPCNAYALLPVVESVSQLARLACDLEKQLLTRAADTWLIPYRIIALHAGRNAAALSRAIPNDQRLDKGDTVRRRGWRRPGDLKQAVNIALESTSLDQELRPQITSLSPKLEGVHVRSKDGINVAQFATPIDYDQAGRRAIETITYTLPSGETGATTNPFDLAGIITRSWREVRPTPDAATLLAWPTNKGWVVAYPDGHTETVATLDEAYAQLGNPEEAEICISTPR